MTAARIGGGTPGASTERLPAGRAVPCGQAARYVVRVVDDVDARIAGHGGCVYTSPAQPRAAALALAALLLGGGAASVDGGARWSRSVAVAGGRRTVTIGRADPTP